MARLYLVDLVFLISHQMRSLTDEETKEQRIKPA